MTIYINDNLVVITSNGVKWGYVGYTITEALKSFVKEGNQLTNKRIKRWTK